MPVSAEDARFLVGLCARDDLGATDLERAREVGRSLPREVAGVPCDVQLAVKLPSGREVVLYDSASDGGRPVRAPRVRRGRGGRWEARPYMGTDPVTGRRVRPQRSWPAEWDEVRAQAACDEWVAGLAPALSQSPSKRLAPMLDAYIRDPVRGFSANTVAAYESVLRNQIAPAIGDVPYDELEPYMVQACYRLALTDRPGRPAVRRKTLRKAHALLAGAYRSWRRQLGRNPMLDVEAPAPELAEPFALGEWDQEALAAGLVSAMSSDATDAGNIRRRTVAFAAYLALNLALRCGEVCWLDRRAWRRSVHDVHVGGTVVERPRLMRRDYPKRGSSGNVSAAPGVEGRMAAHVAWQDSWLDAPGPAAPLVALHPDGRIARPSDLGREFKRLAVELGMPEGTTMHTLRHTHATWLIMHGYDMRTVQERLRHADVRTTLALYTSVLPGRDAAAARAFTGSIEGER